MNRITLVYWLLVFLMPIGIFALFWSAAGVARLAGLTFEGGRKLVHVIAGVSAAAVALYFPREQIASGLVLTALVLPLAARADFFGGVVNSQRTMAGPMALIVAFALLLAFAPDRSTIAIAMLVLAFSDAAAALAGNRWGRSSANLPRGRSWAGSIAFALTAFIIVYGSLLLGGMSAGDSLVLAIACSLAGAATEGLAPSALDNLAVPLVVACLVGAAPQPFWYLTLAELGGTVAIAAISLRLRWLSADGVLAFLLVGAVIIISDGFGIAALLVAFFVSSSILTRIRQDRAVQDDAKTGRRASQVFALAGIPAVLAYFSTTSLSPGGLEAVAAAVVAAAAADTWATEIGRFSRSAPRLLWNGTKMPRGSSGAVTALGLAGAAAGAATIALLSVAFGLSSAPVIIFMLGLGGSLFDSLIGGTAQARYRCEHCEAIGDTPNHCFPIPGTLAGGLPFINNTAVNAIMCFAVAAAAVALLQANILR